MEKWEQLTSFLEALIQEGKDAGFEDDVKFAGGALYAYKNIQAHMRVMERKSRLEKEREKNNENT